ncbi:TonB-dependent receptor [Tahibacter amnicola]|uniref:TonB-dependent receptor n=1 Tax=Tahibacter amnicola TaxID=2976241 RepID=A0ABY6BC69_9GAMM|nr:TonB-dependent receptor [Tahibacter amnicola]UXI67147.1 TonB-dependent receptor [Tahibacter amnicola]
MATNNRRRVGVLCAVVLAASPGIAARAGEDAPASATPPGDSAASDSATTLEGISVVAHGETRQVQRVAADAIRTRPPGINPLRVLEQLPGVHFVAADPWGSYEWSHRIAIRGFDQNQLGYTLDGVPLGDNSYANHNGLSPNRAITAENLRELELAQGAGALRTASTSNLGGTVLLHSDDPLPSYAARTAISVGEYGTRRGFARVDTGPMGGMRGYFSAMHQAAGKWKGDDAAQIQRQINAKLVYEWDGGRVAAYADLSRRNETDYQDLSLGLIRRCGYGWDNYAPDWQRAVAAATDHFSGCVTTRDDAYYDARGLRNDDLVYLRGDFWPNDASGVHAVGYYHRNVGEGHWFTPYIASPTVPVALRITRYDIERSGVIAGFSLVAGDHSVEGGAWAEDSVHGAGRGFVHIDGPIDDGRFFAAAEFDGLLFRQRFDTRTRQWYLQDTWSLADDRLRLIVGFKGQSVITDATVVAAGRAGGRLTTRDGFLPQAGLSWRIDARSDVFANTSENQAAFRPGVNGAWSLDQAAFDQSKPTLRPEQSRTVELGYRRRSDFYQLSASVFGVQFRDRQLVIVPCPGVVSCPNQFANVGSARTRGAELALLINPVGSASAFASVAYTDSTYRSDYVSSGTLVGVAGKTMVDSPRHLASAGVTYRFGDLTAQLAGKYTSERYYTYTNDQRIAGFWLWNAGLAWQRSTVGPIRQLRIALDAYNVFDKRHIATLGSNGFTESDPAGAFATLLEGAPRLLFLSVDARF